MKFSIVIPAFKQRYLKEAIESCLAQTYKNLEVIIVDDASPEDLKSVVDEFSDERIRYYRNEKNCGALNVVDNWNICLGYAEGDYVICMGDDDRLLPICLEEYARLIEEYPEVDVFHGWTEIIDDKSNVTNLLDTRPDRECVLSMMWQRWNVRQQFIGDFLYKSVTLRANGGFYKLPLAWGSDDVTAYINAEAHGIVNTQVPVFQYRQSSITLSSISNGKVKLEALASEKKWTESFLSRIKPSNDIEKTMCDLLIRNLDVRFNERKLCTITKDIRFCKSVLTRVLYWMRLFPALDISASSFTKAILKGIAQH